MRSYNTIVRQISPDLDRDVTLRGNVYQHEHTGKVFGVVDDTAEPALPHCCVVFDFDKGRTDYVRRCDLINLNGWALLPGVMHVTFNKTED